MTAMLRHKSLIYTDDLDSKGRKINTGLLKSISAHEEQTGRELYGAPTTIKCNGKVMWTTNKRPPFDGEDKAIWDRYILIPFNAVYTSRDECVDEKQFVYKQDPIRRDRHLEMTDAFFTFCVEALVAFYKQCGARAGGTAFPVPRAVREALRATRHASLPLARFLEEHCAPSLHPLDLVTVQELFNSYSNWLDQMNEIIVKKHTTLQKFIDTLNGALNIKVTKATPDGHVCGYRLVKHVAPVSINF